MKPLPNVQFLNFAAEFVEIPYLWGNFPSISFVSVQFHTYSYVQNTWQKQFFSCALGLFGKCKYFPVIYIFGIYSNIVLYTVICARQLYPRTIVLCRGCILERNWDKNLKIFAPCYSQSLHQLILLPPQPPSPPPHCCLGLEISTSISWKLARLGFVYIIS